MRREFFINICWVLPRFSGADGGAFYLFTNYYVPQSVQEILGYNENILERLGDDLVTMNGRLMEAGNRISFSSGPVVSRSRDAQNQIQMVDMLREENAANPYITKAYILYENEDMSFSSQGRYAKDILLAGQLRLPEEERQPFLDKLYDMAHPGYDVINKEYHMKDGIITRPQMVFIYPVYNYSYKVESWVVLELQPSKISRSMTTSPGSYSHGIAVLNGEGRYWQQKEWIWGWMR